MLGRAARVLVTALLMFPQIAETIYSPALTDISAQFSVSAPQAAQTLSVYFIGFAAGVLLWGGFSDRYGRRPALLAGLGVYAMGCLMALWAADFSLLLAARIVTAIGAATGSVVTQTVLRDCYSGRQLAGIFSFIGLALAVSPAVGVYIGGGLTAIWGMRGVFSALALLAAVKRVRKIALGSRFFACCGGWRGINILRWRQYWWRHLTSACSATTAWPPFSSPDSILIP